MSSSSTKLLSKILLSLILLALTTQVIHANSNASLLTGIILPEHPSFNGGASPYSISDCNGATATSSKQEHEDEQKPLKPAVKLHLKNRSSGKGNYKESVMESTSRDLIRIQTLHTRVIEKKNQNTLSRLNKEESTISPAASPKTYAADETAANVFPQLMASVESGVGLGSGEYFMDVFIGTPPKHFSLILDTGSDLNWIQCVPCYDCFEQNGPHYNPNDSTSFQNVSCHDPRCSLVSSPDPPLPCKAENQPCPYFYWYGDGSNTTGDFALETFTVNLTAPAGKSEFREVENVMFGCGHWNRGLFHGAAGLLGLGRGGLSFSSQLHSLYGHSFSYCLVDRNSDPSVSSKLIFGEDKDLLNHKELNFTSLVSGNQNSVDTYYYVDIKLIIVGGEFLNISEKTWTLSTEGVGGTIVDSGTTLSYFAAPAYEAIKEAFIKRVKKYKIVDDFPILQPCYNVSGVEKIELPTFGIQFTDGALWSFPVENYFIRLDPEEIVCLAILGTPRSAMSIIGNYQQQNFHVLYDTKKSRLGFAPTSCAEL